MEELLKQLIESEEVNKGIQLVGDVKFFQGMIESKYRELYNRPNFKPVNTKISEICPRRGKSNEVYSLLYMFEQIIRNEYD